MKEKINIKKISRIIILIVGVLFLLYFLFMCYNACISIGTSMKSGGIKFFGNFDQIVQYVMSTTSTPLFYGISCLFYSYIINKDFKSGE